MLRSARKWIAIRRYVKSLGPELRRRYGRAKRYTPAQVKSTIEQRGYSTEWTCYALCMYCGRRDFDAYHRAAGESCDYNVMRGEVAARFLAGAPSFDASDVIDCGTGWSGGNGGSDGDHSGNGDGAE
jgi:hypothetical protein